METIPDNRKRILIVDDERLIRALLARTLEEEGFSCTVTGSLEAARDHLHLASFSLVLCDYDLTDGCGLDLVDEIRAGHFDVPVIVMSGIERADLADRCAGLDADSFLAKPFKLDELLGRVYWLV
jgi:DNA-binding response OmpR family regulator